MHSLDVIVLRNAEAAGREAREADSRLEAAIVAAATEAEREIKDPSLRWRAINAFNREWNHGT